MSEHAKLIARLCEIAPRTRGVLCRQDVEEAARILSEPTADSILLPIAKELLKLLDNRGYPGNYRPRAFCKLWDTQWKSLREVLKKFEGTGEGNNE